MNVPRWRPLPALSAALVFALLVSLVAVPWAAGQTATPPVSGASGSTEADGSASGTTPGDVPAAGTGVPEPPLQRAGVPGVSFGGSHVIVPAGTYHPRDIVSIGGRVTVEGEVRQSVVVIGGVLTVSGTVRRDIVAVGSRVELEDGARVGGEIVNVVGVVSRGPDVELGGEFLSIDPVNLSRFASGRGALWTFGWIFFWVGALLTAVRFLGVLLAASIASDRIRASVDPPVPNWILAFLLGFVVRIFAGVLGLLLLLACVTGPVAVALWIGTRVAIWMGLAAIYYKAGRALGRGGLGADLSYFGAILLGFVLFAVLGFIPVLGLFVTEIMACAALGLMLLTRFGGRRPRPVIGRAAAPGAVPPAPSPAAPPDAGPSGI